MRKYIGILIALIWLPQMGISQAGKSPVIHDTLQIDQLKEIESITEIYAIPHTRYKLDHFIFVRRSVNVDPHLQHNKGERLSGDAKVFLGWFHPGDTLIIKEVYAINSESPERGLVMLPEKRFVVK